MRLSQVQNIALGVYFFSINFEMFDPTYSGIFSVAKLAGIIYLLTFINNPLPMLSIRGIDSYIRPFLLFFVLETLMSILNVNYYYSTFIDFSLLSNLIIMLVMINHERMVPGVLHKHFFYFALGSITLSLLFILNIGVEYSNGSDGRVSLLGENENSLGVRMAISISYIIYITINNFDYNRFSKLFLLLPVPIMLNLLAQTASRTAFFSLAGSVILIVILQKTNHAFTKVIYIIFAIAIAFLIFQYTLELGLLRERLIETQEKGSLSGRDEIWNKIIPFIKENLIVGSGKTGYYLYALKTFGAVASPHNVILEVLSYTGIIGLTLYLLAILRPLYLNLLYFLQFNNYFNILLYVPIFGLLLSGQLLGTKLAYLVFALGISRVFYLRLN